MSTYRPVGLLDLQHDVKTCFKKRWILDGMFLKTRFLFTTCSCLFVCTVSFGSFFAATLFNRMRQHIVFCQLLQQGFALAQIAIAIAIAWLTVSQRKFKA
jgi:hypothetical protein